MDLFFNEISSKYEAESIFHARKRMSDFTEICKRIKDAGFSKCMRPDDFFESSILKDNTNYSWLKDLSVRKDERNFILSFMRTPFEPQEDENIERYISFNYLLDEPDEPNFNGTLTKGLAMSYIFDTLSIGFPSNEVWVKNNISLIEESNGNRQQVSVRHLSTEEGFKYHNDWFAYLVDLVLVQTDVIPDAKKIHVSDDHGKDKLMLFAKKLVLSPYVIEIPYSLPFDTSRRSLIRKMYPDGRIALTLLRDDSGYSLMVQTTGRNYRETEAIAQVLKDNYSD